MPESVQSCFELSIHFSRELFLDFLEQFTAGSLRQTNVQNTVISRLFAYSSKWRRKP